MEKIGTLSALRRYPVKSMAGEDLTEARVTFAGIVGDRVFAFVQKDNHSDFPWMTGRQGHELILFRPRFLESPTTAEEYLDAGQFAAEVTTPEGEKFRMGDPIFTAYIEKRFARPVKPRFSERSQTDSRPVSIFGLSTVRALSDETGIELDPRRFRANFYVRWENDQPFFEDQLVGHELRIGETVTIHVVKKDQRCVMITLDPETAVRASIVFENVMRVHDSCVGVYGAVLREGIVRTNDPIYLMN
ncbi:MAG: MOSC domain-containing protein [Candidatus Acidiferrales bacterium]